MCRYLDSPSDCKVSNIGYSLQCKLCKKRGKQVYYIGESSRNSYLRGGEHLRAYENGDKKSIMLRHVKAEHKGEEQEVEFDMKVTGKFQDCLSRQIDESLRLRNMPQSSLLNSKSEFYGPCIKRKVYEEK